MAYDEDLAERVRELIAAEPGVTERRMFGGLAFLLDGHLAIAVSRHGGVLVRVAPDQVDRLIAAGAEPAEMGSRRMRGWVRVDAERLRTKRQLSVWVRRGVAQARA